MSIIFKENELPKEIELKAYNATKIYNERFGKLVALYPYGKTTDNKILWLCKCDCGNYCGVTAKRLCSKTKPTRSCGCLRLERVREEQGAFKEGDIIGGLKVLKRFEDKSLVQCLYCQKEYEIKSCSLLSLIRNNIKNSSCGCQKGRLITENKIIDLSGETFGDTVVLETLKQVKNHSAINKCQCSCGKIFYATSRQLKERKIVSCGCQDKLSYGAAYIKNLLDTNNIIYTQEYTFEDLKGDKECLRFDFALFDNNKLVGLIEYNGQQHYTPISIFGGQEEFERRQKYDERKIKYCNDKNIELMIISYKDVYDIKIEDILERMHINGEQNNRRAEGTNKSTLL